VTRAEVDDALARILARALVAELRAEMACTGKSPATAGTVQGSTKEIANDHDHRTPTAA
jgi:hypothetical protein